MPKKYVIKESTRERCKVFTLSSDTLKRFRPVNLEHFQYLLDAEKVDFNIFIRVGREMIEYIRSEEMNRELLLNVWDATQRMQADVDVYVKTEDFNAFVEIINSVRTSKIAKLIDLEPRLDRKTLELFHDLSTASEVIMRGGIDQPIVERASATVSLIVSQLFSSEHSLSTLSRMISIDPTLYDHSASVAMFSAIIAKQYPKVNFTQEELEKIALCGLFHDVGKAHIPNCILNKPGKFTDYEYSVMKTHTTLGFREVSNAIAEGAQIDPIVPLVVIEHHERMNGSGYPFQKSGRLEETPRNGIHLYSRIVAIADTYSAMLMDRIYQPAMSAERAIETMNVYAQDHFDLEVYDPFAKYLISNLKLFENQDFFRPKHETNTLIYAFNSKKITIQPLKATN